MTFKGYLAIVLTVEVVASVAAPILTGSLTFLLVALTIPLTLAVWYAVWRRKGSISYQVRRVSPEEIIGYNSEPVSEVTAGQLSRSIVERSEEIRRTLQGSPAEIQVEMCAFGYRACVDDMITLTHLIKESLPDASLTEKVKLRRDRRRATEALAKARETLPPGVLKATHQQEQQ